MRTDGDSWDITTSVGSTALFVAAARALAARESDPLAVDPFAEVFVRAAGEEWIELLDGKNPEHPLFDPNFGIPFRLFQAARTRYFDAYFRDAVAAGVRQVVILAAGLDSRAYRLPWPDGTVIYELDRPQVLEFKRETLSAHGDKPLAERREVAADLREDWRKALRDSGFDPSQPTAWLIEGLVIYLPAAAVDQLYTDIEQVSAPGSRVAIEQMEQLSEAAAAVFTGNPDDSDETRTEWFQLIYNDQRTDAAQWFADHGWHADHIDLSDYIRTQGRSLPDPAPGTPQISDLVSLVTVVRP